jgi:hypothetical protein
MLISEILSEAWSQKYKDSIDCHHPKGFSQKAHCAGKKKHNESVEMEMTCPDCGMCETHGDNLVEVKQRLDAKCWKGYKKQGTKIKGGVRVNNCVPESLDADQKRVGQVGAKEKAKPIGQVLAKPTKQHPFKGRLVGEARSNPEQNVKSESGMKELMAIANTISDPENWAISMTSEAKLGINPQVGISEDTPKGIYFYPLDYAVDLARRGKKLPWGNDYPYIQLFQYDRSGEMTKETSVDPEKLKQALLQYCPEDVIQQAIDEPEYDGTPYWFIYDCLSRLGQGDETNIVRWNKVLRDLGFTSVFDPGHGWIAYNEPTQGVVLDPRIIKQHKTISNRKEARVVTPAKIEQTIFDTLDIELAASRAWQAYDPDGSKLKAAAKEYAKDPRFKPYMGKPGTEEIYDKASSLGRYGARQLSQEAYEWYKAQQAVKQESVVEGYGKYYCSTDKRWKERKGPKQTRNS